jgi:hypothetical protein
MDLYGYHHGVKFRVQVDKHPDIETIRAIHKMVELASKIKIDKNDTDNRKATR